MAAVCLATFAVLADFMAVAVALPTVQKGLDASFSEVQWVMEAFVVALVGGVLAGGYMAGRHGRRRVFLAASAVLAGGSLAAAVAPTVYVLIGARALQGVGAAMLLATTAAVLPFGLGEANGRAGAITWATTTAAALAVSPLVGGLVVTYLGWRWVFGLTAVATAVAFLFALVAIRPSPLDVTDGAPSDWRGLLLFTGATSVLVAGLVRTATTLGSWSQSGVLACIGCSALMLFAFVATESVSPNPLLDVSLFRHRTFTGSAIAAFGLSMAVFGPFIFLTLYLTYSLGYSALNVGDHLLLLSAMALAILPLAALLDRLLPVKAVICGGLVLVGAGLWLMSRLPSSVSWQTLLPGLIVAGVGLELVNPRLASTAAAGAAGAAGEERGLTTASLATGARASTVMRQLGAATGVAVLGSVFATRLSDEVSSRLVAFPQLAPDSPQISAMALDGQTRAAVSSAPPLARPALTSIIQTSFTGTMHEVFLIAAGVAVISAVLALSIRSSDLKRASAPGVVQSVRAAPAAEKAEIGPDRREWSEWPVTRPTLTRTARAAQKQCPPQPVDPPGAV